MPFTSGGGGGGVGTFCNLWGGFQCKVGGFLVFTGGGLKPCTVHVAHMARAQRPSAKVCPKTSARTPLDPLPKKLLVFDIPSPHPLMWMVVLWLAYLSSWNGTPVFLFLNGWAQ